MSANAAILESAGEYLGLAEYPGAKHNQAIVDFFSDVGHSWVSDDETPWCAAFVGHVLGSLGLPHTGKLNARSYMNWGYEVSMAEAQPGDVVILWRGNPSGWQGHVAFLVRFDGDKVILRGGNQGNKVSDASYPVSRILGIRRADMAVAKTNRQTLRQGSRGQFVIELQTRLSELGYFSGRIDGIFGPRTRGSVLTFQADVDLGTDGVVGPKTWEALDNAKQRPVRLVTEADLRESGSRTIAGADGVSGVTQLAGATGAVAAVVAQGQEAVATVKEATGLLGTAQELIMQYWPILGIGLAVWGVLYYSKKIKEARVNDAQTGANVSR